MHLGTCLGGEHMIQNEYNHYPTWIQQAMHCLNYCRNFHHGDYHDRCQVIHHPANVLLGTWRKEYLLNCALGQPSPHPLSSLFSVNC
jgi:hypothetical protein